MESDIHIPVSIFSHVEDSSVNRLANDVWIKTHACMKKPFSQAVTAEICEIILTAQQTARAENLNFTCSNPFRITLFSGDSYNIYFEDYQYVEEEETKTIPSGAVYKILECGQARVW